MSNSDDEDENFGLGDVFPEEKRPASPPPSVVPYTRPNGETVSVRLVSSHPLWGHVLYPTSICLSDFLAQHAQKYVKGRRVLELGAGGGLPSLVACLEGAAQTVVTDFPDADLVNNLQWNIDNNIPPELRDLICAQGYTWGSRTDALLDLVSSAGGRRRAYDTIIAADLVFNHSQHLALLKTCEACLAESEDGVVLCFYAHHRPTPELIAKDEAFLSLATSRGWTVSRVYENPRAGPAFPGDTHWDLAVRSTVHGWELRRTTKE